LLDRGDIRARLMVLQRKNSTTFPVITLPQVLFDAQGRFAGGLTVLVELATIETAKPLGSPFRTDLRAELHRIALQIQSLGITAGSVPMGVPLEHPDFADLTEREREVLTQLASGDRVPAIAKKLFISPHTVRNHLKGIFRKVGVGSQTALLERVRAATTVGRE
jgi:DNA-binding CsgD family transcriptional regulator